MKTEAVTTVLNTIHPKFVNTEYRREHGRWIVYMLTTTITAAITAIFGLALAGASLLHMISPESPLGFIGTILLALTFPLLVLSAHCLDRIEDVNRANRVASYKRIVFGDESNSVSAGGLEK